MLTNVRRLAIVLVGGFLLVSTAACGSDNPADGGVPAPPVETTAVGLPRYDKSTVDDSLCEIFRRQDFTTVNMITSKVETRPFVDQNNKSVGVVCNFALDDTVGAGLFADQTLATEYVQAVRRAGVTDDVVTGATESFFGPTGSEDGEFQVVARRGSLVVFVNLDPKINKFSAEQARLAGVALAKIVLDRAPNLG